MRSITFRFQGQCFGYSRLCSIRVCNMLIYYIPWTREYSPVWKPLCPTLSRRWSLQHQPRTSQYRNPGQVWQRSLYLWCHHYCRLLIQSLPGTNKACKYGFVLILWPRARVITPSCIRISRSSPTRSAHVRIYLILTYICFNLYI